MTKRNIYRTHLKWIQKVTTKEIAAIKVHAKSISLNGEISAEVL